MGYQQDDEDEAQQDNFVMQDQENDEDPKVDVAKDMDPVGSESPSPPPPSDGPGQSPDAKSQTVRDMLNQKYGAAADPTKLQTARQQEAAGVQHANLMHHLSGLFLAGSVAAGGPGASEQDYQTQLKQAHMPVQQAEEDRQNAIKTFLTGQKLGRESDSDLQKQKLWQVENDTNDPTSQKSQMAVHLFQTQFPGALKGWSDQEKAQLTASDIGKLALPGQEKAAQLKMAQTMAQQRLDMVREKVQFQQDQKGRQNATVDLKDLGKDLDSETASGRSGLGNANSKVDSANRLLQFVDLNPNSPEDMDLLKASKTNPQARAQLVQKMDSLTPQQRSEVVSGLMTQLSPGGGGSLGQFNELKGETFAEKLANAKQWATGAPVPAGVGDMIVNNLQTLANERNTSQTVLDKHAKSMRTKHPLAFQHPDTADMAEAMIKGAAQPPAPAASPAPTDGGPGTATAAPASGMDDKIQAYASAHKLDYATAKSLLVKRGYQPSER